MGYSEPINYGNPEEVNDGKDWVQVGVGFGNDMGLSHSHHLRVYSRLEFKLWREALYPKITNTTPTPSWLLIAGADVGLDDNTVDPPPSTAEEGDERSKENYANQSELSGSDDDDDDDEGGGDGQEGGFPSAPPMPRKSSIGLGQLVSSGRSLTGSDPSASNLEDSGAVGPNQPSLQDSEGFEPLVQPPASANSGDEDFQSSHPSIMRLSQRHIPTRALDASTWHEPELRPNAEGIPGEDAGPEAGSSSFTIEQRDTAEQRDTSTFGYLFGYLFGATNQLEIAAGFDVDGDGDIGEDGHLNRDPEACAEPEDPEMHRL